MSIYPINTSHPGYGPTLKTTHKYVGKSIGAGYIQGGGYIDAAKTRDVTNILAPRLLNPGLLMGKASGGLWANSILGVSASAITGAGTTLTVSAAVATEIVRRNGETGTLSLVGGATANATARQLAVTYSAVDVVTGAVTITGLGTNQAEDVRLAVAASGGNIQLNVSKPDGTRVTTGNAAWSATDATFLANINTALDTATGVVGGIVATAISATDTDLGFTLTYSGTGYAGRTWPPAAVALLPTSSASWFVVPRTTAVEGRFVAGSLVGGNDGSEVPRSYIDTGYGLTLGTDEANTPAQVAWPRIPYEAYVAVAQLVNWPTDTGIQDWIMNKMSTPPGGKFTFDAVVY